MKSDKSLTLEEYSKQILKPMTDAFVKSYLEEKFFKNAMIEDMKYYGMKPPTKWQRFKFKLGDYKQRAKYIWAILKGEDIHKNCGY